MFLVITGAFLLSRLQIRSNEIFLSKFIPALPYLIIFPTLNPFIEEIRYRNVLLGLGVPVLGATSTLLMTTVLFGLSHFVSFLGASGSGGSFVMGLTYALGAACMGWVNGKSMLETHGVLEAWIMHMSADLIIILGYIVAT
ncbi:MAG: CPBP family intramembrane glutamic endopeptidase [Candidatus Kryptoniota bacterium]